MPGKSFWNTDHYSNRDKKKGEAARKKRGMVALALLASLGKGSNRRNPHGRCNGDCAHCPPHYGYRYGRWYYGRGHMRGCEKGGNGEASGKCRFE